MRCVHLVDQAKFLGGVDRAESCAHPVAEFIELWIGVSGDDPRDHSCTPLLVGQASHHTLLNRRVLKQDLFHR